MEIKANLFKAILGVMKAVKGIDKSSTVGTGSNAYKGVSDKDVKEAIGKAMVENGLGILPIAINPTVTVERWEETNQYGNNPPVVKMKQQVFTEVKTRYLLFHVSGESIEIEGYGHGIDTQDKSAGKATTYALKNTLLYSYMVATGLIDDTDNTHSDNHQIPSQTTPKQNTQSALKLLKVGSAAWKQLTEKVGKGETITKEELKKYFDIKEVEKDLETLNIF
ncbi:ERF family protein [Chryseobacterium sp. JV274]|uniref:ERF family protein n=1 Tax=Chryseobacterium sp. JV274 TaxID=1932669 RepID=UPI000984BFAA|nr:ERF family protein [Chryseobacterium sp. JV274]